MKVILLNDVPKVGKKYDVRDVADGHALNHLLPNRHAIFASKSALEKSAIQRAQWEKGRKQGKEEAATALAALQDTIIEIQEKANEQGHLFASIGEEEIADAIFQQKKIKITPEMVDIDKPLKEVGERDITLRLGDLRAVFRLAIVPE